MTSRVASYKRVLEGDKEETGGKNALVQSGNGSEYEKTFQLPLHTKTIFV